MKRESLTPTLRDDMGTIASLYKTVFWMMGKRLQYGRDWEKKLTEQAVRHPLRSPGPVGPRTPHPTHN